MTLGVVGERELANGDTGMDEGGPMMMITITVILEGWKSRHALLPVLIHSAADFSYQLQYDQKCSKLFSEK